LKTFFDKLNMRPGERRLVVIVGIVVFLVLNLVFIWPNFGAYAKVNAQITRSQTDLRRFTMEVNNKDRYERELKNLQTAGGFVAQDDQTLQLQIEVANQARANQVNVLRTDPAPRMTTGRTNAFFDESSVVINVSTSETNLVDFLYNLSSRNTSLIRVRSMTLSPEPSRFRLQGTLTHVESFQKKPPVRPAVAAVAPVTKPTAKPAPKAKPVETNKPPAKPLKTPPVKPPANTKTNQSRKVGPLGK
jgi:hypothetical protein